MGWEYEHLENTRSEKNGPLPKNPISITDSNITTVPNYEISSHTAETSLNETISAVLSSRLWTTLISRKNKFYEKIVQL